MVKSLAYIYDYFCVIELIGADSYVKYLISKYSSLSIEILI